MARYAFFIDLSICAGCESCTVACQNKNGLPPEIALTKIHRYQAGTFPNLKSTFVANQCLHCENPPCADVCPTGATYKSAEGPVQVNDRQCIGCKYCIAACPFGARTYDEAARVVRKCTECYDRLQAGTKPACVQTCITGARQIGDLDDPQSPIHEAIAKSGTVKVAGTNFYFRKADAIPRTALPADSRESGVTYAWQSILQPFGQLLMGGAAAAVLVSLGAFAVKGIKKEGNDHGDH
jgi:Fe-S-cluster-containing dehydrogenase component